MPSAKSYESGPGQPSSHTTIKDVSPVPILAAACVEILARLILEANDRDSQWTWFASEYDPSRRLFFGLVIGFEAELGYFSLDELEEARGGLGLPIERDLNFRPKRP